MFESFLSVFSTARQAGPLVAAASALTTGVIIFASAPFLEMLGLHEFRNVYRPFIGATFLASLSLVVFYCLSAFANLKGYVFSKIRKWKTKRKENLVYRTQLSAVKNLTAREKNYLMDFVIRGEYTRYYQWKDETAKLLRDKKILYIDHSTTSRTGYFAHHINPWAKTLLIEDSTFLDRG